MENNKKLNPLVFWPPFVLLIASVILSFLNDEMFAAIFTNAFGWVTTNFGWLFMFGGFVFLAICVILFFSPAGKIRFGGEDAKPHYTNFQWFAMCLCGGIAIGIVFWGVAEPILHISAPPETLGIKPNSAEAVLFSISTSFLHWTFTPYAIYAIATIPIALAVYNYAQPMTISSSLYFLIGDKCRGNFGKIIDAICLFSIAAGVATSMGQGIMQIGSGLNFLSGIEPTKFVWAIIAMVVAISFTASSYLGINKGLKWLSNQNVKLYIFVLLYILLLGPTVFIFNLGIEGFGEYITTFLTKSLFLSSVEGDQWPSWFTIFYWAVWIAYAPVVGVFLTRLCYGRTIREFLAYNLVAPALFGMIWFAIFGSTAIEMQINNKFDFWSAFSTAGLESSVFTFFNQFPFGIALVFIFLIVILISFVTMADSMTSVCAILSTSGFSKEDHEPPAYLKVVWGAVMGSLAWVMISFAGINGTKMLAVLASFPLLFLMIVMTISGLKGVYAPETKWFTGFKKKNSLTSTVFEESNK